MALSTYNGGMSFRQWAKHADAAELAYIDVNLRYALADGTLNSEA